MSEEVETSAKVRKGPGLTARFVLAFCGLFLVFGSGVVFTVWESDQRAAEARARLLLDDRALTLAEQMDEALAASDGASAQTAANGLGRRHGMVAVRLVARDGSLLADGEDPDARRIMDRLATGGERFVMEKGLAATTVSSASGRVFVTATSRSLRQGFHGSAALIASVFFGFGALAALIAWFMARSIAQPLRKLTAMADMLRDKNAAQPLDLKTGDELETLARAFNAMAEKVQANMRRLQRMAYSDTATGLPNHERFTRDVTDFLSNRHDEVGALFVVRLDRLDRIFDAIGQDAGDELLTRIVGRLSSAVRAIDRMVRTEHCTARPSQLARLRGGDFGVLTPRFRGQEDAARFAQLLASALNQPFDWREHKLVLGAAIGAALLPQDGADADTAIRHAMLALTAARSDNGRMKFFTKALDREANAQLAFEREMRAALERNEFKAFFQPKVDLLSGRVIGAEALARWVKPDRTMVSPGRFIPAAEENGLIGSISEVILRDACWKAASWAREGFPLSVAINISPLQFADERFTDKILRSMAEAGLSPDRVELEITESVALENPERALRLLEPLREVGVKVSLDDFGCGHSSLASLTRLPFDIIKIDQQFVRALAKDRHAPAIIEMILAMAASLDYTVVAEGIETEQEADFLRRRGCQIGQGFLWGAAMPATEFLQFNAARSGAISGGQRGVA
ncbi:MAG: EAL domain-containing protein [Hyphomonadaceae bacterium]|nr:EAL domain-containing protein [Hyphomonadaceae bacterium]